MSEVQDIYQREFPRLQQDDTIVQAVQQLREFNLTGAPVFDNDNNLVGYLSEQDCLAAMLHASYFCSLHNTIAQVMSKKSGDSACVRQCSGCCGDLYQPAFAPVARA